MLINNTIMNQIGVSMYVKNCAVRPIAVDEQRVKYIQTYLWEKGYTGNPFTLVLFSNPSPIKEKNAVL